MMMDGEIELRIYQQIVQGVPKNKSPFVTDEESSQYWDEVAAEVEQMRRDDPGVIFEMVSD